MEHLERSMYQDLRMAAYLGDIKRRYRGMDNWCIPFCHVTRSHSLRLQRMILWITPKCINYGRPIIIQRILRILLHKYHTIIVLYVVNIWIQSSDATTSIDIHLLQKLPRPVDHVRHQNYHQLRCYIIINGNAAEVRMRYILYKYDKGNGFITK